MNDKEQGIQMLKDVKDDIYKTGNQDLITAFNTLLDKYGFNPDLTEKAPLPLAAQVPDRVHIWGYTCVSDIDGDGIAHYFCHPVIDDMGFDAEIAISQDKRKVTISVGDESWVSSPADDEDSLMKKIGLAVGQIERIFSAAEMPKGTDYTMGDE